MVVNSSGQRDTLARGNIPDSGGHSLFYRRKSHECPPSWEGVSPTAEGVSCARISVIIPTLDEEASLPRTIRSCREAGPCEVVVADGGSRDRTVEIAREQADAVVASPRGRAAQMNAGAAVARGDVLLFLHADSRLAARSVTAVLEALQGPAVIGGAFRLRLAPSPGAGRYARGLLGITGRMIGVRACVTRSFTGDQAIFVRAETFRGVGGYPEIPLLEDVELSRRLGRGGASRSGPVHAPESASAQVTRSGVSAFARSGCGGTPRAVAPRRPYH